MGMITVFSIYCIQLLYSIIINNNCIQYCFNVRYISCRLSVPTNSNPVKLCVQGLQEGLQEVHRIRAR